MPELPQEDRINNELVGAADITSEGTPLQSPLTAVTRNW